MFLDQLFASSVQADVVNFRIHDFRETLQHLRVCHVDLVQQDPLALLKRDFQNSVTTQKMYKRRLFFF